MEFIRKILVPMVVVSIFVITYLKFSPTKQVINSDSINKSSVELIKETLKDVPDENKLSEMIYKKNVQDNVSDSRIKSVKKDVTDSETITKKKLPVKKLDKAPPPAIVEELKISNDSVKTGFFSSSGSAGTYSLQNLDLLKTTVIYKIDLSSLVFTGFSLKWKEGEFMFGYSRDSTLPDLVKMDVDDEVGEDLGESISPLISSEDRAVKYIYIKFNKLPKKFGIDFYNSTSINDYNVAKTLAMGVFNRNSGANYTTLNIKSRSEWGANADSWDSRSSEDINSINRLRIDNAGTSDPADDCRWLPEYYRISRIIIHHTATNNYSTDTTKGVRNIYLYHAYTRGWGDIGYNYVIDTHGNIFEGKIGGNGVKGYHAFEYANETSVGISLMGDFSYARPSDAAIKSLIKLMAEKAVFHNFKLKYCKRSLSNWLDPTCTVFGHRDSYAWDYDANKWNYNNTSCPGNYWYNTTGYYSLTDITNRAEDYRKSNFSQLKEVVDKVENAFSGNYERNKIYVLFNKPTDVPESEIRELIPAFSGISSVRIKSNMAIITVKDGQDNGYCGWIVPPIGYTGYDTGYETFTPASKGAEDRMKDLLKVFMLDPNVKTAGINSIMTLNDSAGVSPTE